MDYLIILAFLGGMVVGILTMVAAFMYCAAVDLGKALDDLEARK